MLFGGLLAENFSNETRKTFLPKMLPRARGATTFVGLNPSKINYQQTSSTYVASSDFRLFFVFPGSILVETLLQECQ